MRFGAENAGWPTTRPTIALRSGYFRAYKAGMAVPGSKRKVGRKAAHYRTSWGEVINGLARRLSDGVWRVIATGQKYTEPDERLAVHIYRTRYVTARTSTVAIPLPAGPTPVLTQFDHANNRVTQFLPEAVAWAWVREQILTRPAHVAQMTGIPEIGFLASIPKPKASPTLKAIGDLYLDKAQITEPEKRKSRFMWDEFVEATGLQTVRELTAEVFAEYGDKVRAAVKSPTYVRHRFGKIKTILNFARTRGVQPMADLRAALDASAVLRPPSPRHWTHIRSAVPTFMPCSPRRGRTSR